MSKKIATGDAVSPLKGHRFMATVVVVLPLLGLAMLGFLYLDDIRRWRGDSIEHWMLLASVVFVIVSHVLALVVLCMKTEDAGDRTEDLPD